MKKTIQFLGMAALAAVGIMMTGCSDNEDFNAVPPQPAENNALTQTITVGLNGTATRALTESGVKTFAEGDKIAVVYTNTGDETVKVESVELKAEDISSDEKNATFTVTLTDAPKPNGDVRYIYPAVMAKEDGSVNYDALANQDGTLATLESTLDVCQYEGSLTAEGTLPTGISLDNLLAIGKFTIKHDAVTAIFDITSTVTRFAVTVGNNIYSVTREAAAGPIYVAMKPVNNGDFKFFATDGTDDYGKTVPGKTFEASHLYPISISMEKDLPVLACPDGNHPHMIDLGLPSGTKWACCNVGASTPEGYGNYYAWGETQPKSVYDWDTYQYGYYNYYGDDSHLVNIGSDIAGTGYDAATVNWGAPWRMPSLTQIQELLNNCSTEMTTYNGKSVRKFTGQNGGSIFLPFTGFRLGANLNGGMSAYYWSSVLHEGWVLRAYYLVVGPGGWYGRMEGIANWGSGYRCGGLSVRPVR